MSDYNRIDDAALDRHITGNYGEDQFKKFDEVECCACGGLGKLPVITLDPVKKTDEIDCYRCNGTGWLKDSGDDPDRKYDEERDRPDALEVIEENPDNFMTWERWPDREVKER